MGVIVIGPAVDGEHTGGIADSQHLLSRELPVDIARQRCQIGKAGNMLLSVENRLLQMGNAPALGNVELKQLRQLRRGLSGGGILPGAEGREQFPRLVEREVAVHHGGKAHTANGGQRYAVLPPHILRQIPITVPQAAPYFLQRIGPATVFIGAFPVVAAGGDG
ncbi:hypothetical protein SDC9_190665 [bioreactor metagenome]|uniref:Uncharacterized protein n=1 Tax=bioreactor metagenome TaxID=1076179 RepID=A0A645HWY9_9ZZZZ